MSKISVTELPDRAVLAATGPEAADFLQGLLSNDIRAAADAPVYAALLTPQGKFLHDMLVVPSGDGFLLDCAAARKDDLMKRLRMYRLRAKVELSDRSAELAVLALFTPGAEPAAAPGATPVIASAAGDAEIALHADPRLPALGWRAIVPRDRLDAFGPVAASPADYDRHRLALGIPEGAPDIEEGKGLLLESNFEELHGVDFAKGCYVGQELTARTKHRALVKKRLWLVRGPDRGLPPPGTQILLDGQDAGRMGSSRDGVGLALLRLDKLRASVSGDRPLTADGLALQPERPPYLDAALLQSEA